MRVINRTHIQYFEIETYKILRQFFLLKYSFVNLFITSRKKRREYSKNKIKNVKIHFNKEKIHVSAFSAFFTRNTIKKD